MYIVIEGNIGAGKTSLTEKLQREFGGSLIYEEFAKNEFLADFYKEPEKHAFQLELSFLTDRYKQLESEFGKPLQDFYIADYHFEKSLHFAGINLKPSELTVYTSIFNILNSKIRKPDLLIFLKKSVDGLKRNIEQRGRTFEVGITEEYLLKIDDAYKKLIKNNSFENFLEIDTEHIDFVNNSNDYELIINAIKGKLSAKKC